MKSNVIVKSTGSFFKSQDALEASDEGSEEDEPN